MGATYYLPQGLACVLFLALPALLVAALCSASFAAVVAPLVSPTWAMRILDPSYDSAAVLKDEWRFSWRWLLVIVGGGLVMNAVASVNGFSGA